MIAHEAAFHWFLLSRCRGIGTRTINRAARALRDAGLTLEDAVRYLDWTDFSNVLPMLGRAVYDALRCPASATTERDFQRLIDGGVQIISTADPRYPERVSDRLGEDAPALLYCLGSVRLLEADGVAIVGSRHPSDSARSFAAELAGQLALGGKNIVSGYAAGIDSEAHRGAIGAGGSTSLILSSGIFEFHLKTEFQQPMREHDILAVSQFDPSERWRARNAMTRNKTVCALSQAVVVVESDEEVDSSGRRSGTFDAGMAALRMRIPLFVLAPECAAPSATGNRRLIELGGVQVTPEDAAITVLERSRLTTAIADPSPPILQQRLL